MFDENWGCVDPSELFSSSGKTQSLSYLVEQLQQASSYDSIINADRQFPEALTPKAADDVKVISNGVWSAPSTSNGRSHIAPKILKQKRGLVERPPSLKRVTFEVERFVVDNMENNERESAETRLALRLGAKPERRPTTNYKALVAERKAEKAEAAEAAANGLNLDQMPVLQALNKFGGVQKKAKGNKKVQKRRK